jgi:hypothetical protein
MPAHGRKPHIGKRLSPRQLKSVGAQKETSKGHFQMELTTEEIIQRTTFKGKVELLRLPQLALGGVQEPQVVDRVEGRRVRGAQRLLVPGQRPLIHLLRC